MNAPLPTFAMLAGDIEPRVIEASRLYRSGATPTEPAAYARTCLLGATDAAAREGALRWIENCVTPALQMAEALEGARADADDTSEWDMEGSLQVHAALASVLDYVKASAMPRDPDWPSPGKVAMDMCDPTVRGDATRLLRDMWWIAMLHEHRDARSKPGQWLASTGIVAEHVQQVLGEAEEVANLANPREIVGEAEEVNVVTEPDEQLMTVRNPGLATGSLTVHTEEGPLTLQPGQSVTLPAPREHPPMSKGGNARLPGARRASQPEPAELRDAFKLLAGAEISNNPELLKSLAIAKSTWNNWLSGRTAPRVDLPQAKLLAAECERMMADIESAWKIFRDVTK